jgi:hypothetical protein
VGLRKYQFGPRGVMKPFRIKLLGGEIAWPSGDHMPGAERQFNLLVDGVTDYAIYMLDPTVL